MYKEIKGFNSVNDYASPIINCDYTYKFTDVDNAWLCNLCQLMAKYVRIQSSLWGWNSPCFIFDVFTEQIITHSAQFGAMMTMVSPQKFG